MTKNTYSINSGPLSNGDKGKVGVIVTIKFLKKCILKARHTVGKRVGERVGDKPAIAIGERVGD